MDLEKYHAFWQRFVASLIDGMILTPVSYPTAIILGYAPRGFAIAWLLVTCPVGFMYTSYCHGRWGRTLGKYAAGIRVVRAADESRLGYQRAVRRDLGQIVFALIGAAILVSFIAGGGDRDHFRVFDSARLDYSDEELETMSTGQVLRDSFGEAFGPWQLMVVPALSSLWFFAELGTMLSNPRRRALHDLIGGSVVIKAPANRASTAVPL